MNKFLRSAIQAIPAVISLFRKKTPAVGKAVAASGAASLTIAGLISSGRLAGGDLDSMLLIILAILEAAGYLYGLVTLSAGASQTCPEQDLLEGKGEGLTSDQAKILGREWIRKKQQQQLNQIKQTGMDTTPKPRDLSDY